MIELAQLFSDVEAAVISHEDAVEDIESKTELIAENVDKGNKELDGGIKAAGSRNRKKCYCLGGLCEFFFLFFFFHRWPPPSPTRLFEHKKKVSNFRAEVRLTVNFFLKNLTVVLVLIIAVIIVIITQVVLK